MTNTDFNLAYNYNDFKNVQDLCATWQYQLPDGQLKNYQDLMCIIINIKFEMFVANPANRLLKFKSGKVIDFLLMTESVGAKIRPIQKCE